MKQFVALFVSLMMVLSTVSTAYAIRGHDMIYDANGNLIQGDGFYYEYNDANQLKRVREDNSSGTIIAEYWYDTDGRRVKKVEYTDEGNKTTYYWDKDYETVVYPDGTEVEYLYIYANNEKIAKKVFNGSNTKVYYYHTDHLGSSSVITDENGSLVERTKYYPYGSIREGGEANKYYFTGKELDKDTGLYYYGARYYHPVFATFTQADTIIPNVYNPQSLNRYAYTLNNPLRYIDPQGHAVVGVVAIQSISMSLKVDGNGVAVGDLSAVKNDPNFEYARNENEFRADLSKRANDVTKLYQKQQGIMTAFSFLGPSGTDLMIKLFAGGALISDEKAAFYADIKRDIDNGNWDAVYEKLANSEYELTYQEYMELTHQNQQESGEETSPPTNTPPPTTPPPEETDEDENRNDKWSQ